uniref:Replicase n=1 Tax=Agaricus bisporus virus 6 TaxID=1945750 RepID=A0A1Q1M970_9VIRU|nr:replicase [Agaricus bisporus virus 6]
MQNPFNPSRRATRAQFRAASTAGCQEHPRGCPPRADRLPYGAYAYAFGSPSETEIEAVDSMTCLSQIRYYNRFVATLSRYPELRLIPSSCDSGCHRPDVWLEIDGNLFAVDSFWTREALRYYGFVSEVRLMGHVRICVVCGRTRNEVRRMREDQAIQDHLAEVDDLEEFGFEDPIISPDGVLQNPPVQARPVLSFVKKRCCTAAVDCRVCMDDRNESGYCFFKCGHGMCATCAISWLENGVTCHICRTLIECIIPECSHQLRGRSNVRRKFSGANGNVQWATGQDLPQFDIAFGAESEVVVEPVLDIALNAERGVSDEKKRSRGGKRNKAKREGFCYLKAVPKTKREEAEQILGCRPTIGQVSDFYLENSIIPRNLKVEFMGAGAHMVRRFRWPAVVQWSIISQLDASRRLGAEVWSDDDLLTKSCRGDDVEDFSEHQENVAENVATLLETLEPFNQLPHLPISESFIDEENDDDLEDGEWVDRQIRGSGDCWKKIPYINMFPGIHSTPLENDKHVTVDQIVKWSIPRRGFLKYVWVLAEMDEDEDYHLVDVYDAGFAEPDPPEDYINFLEWLEIIEEFAEKFVGSPTKSPIDENIKQTFSPDVRSALEKMTQPLLRDGLDRAHKYCPYHIPKDLTSFADDLQIPWTQTETQPHPHPIHAAIRRWAYFDALPKYINTDVTLVGMKPAHAKMLENATKNLPGKENIKFKTVNPVVDLKDISRYSGTSTVPEEVFSLGSIDTPTVLFDESGHYLSPGFLLKLRQNDKLRCILMTNIFPLLALEHETSPYPEYVDWRIVRKLDQPILIYIPEGDMGGKYEQPYDPTMTLLSRVEDEDGTVVWNGGVVERKGNYRVQAFYPYNITVPNYVAEREEVMMEIPRLFREQPRTRPIRVEYFNKMFQYAKTLPSDKQENQWGKLRQFADLHSLYFPVGDQEWLVKVVMEAAKLTLAADLQSKSYNNLSEEVYYKTVGHLVRIYHKKFAGRYARRNTEMVNAPDPVRLFPAVNCVVSSFEGSMYSVSWKIETTVDHNFWQSMKMWLMAKTNQPTREVNNSMLIRYEKGKVVFPFIGHTKYTLRLFGESMIAESQRRDFRKFFENVEDKARPVFDIRERKLPPKFEDKLPKLPSRLLSFDASHLRKLTQPYVPRFLACPVDGKNLSWGVGPWPDRYSTSWEDVDDGEGVRRRCNTPQREVVDEDEDLYAPLTEEYVNRMIQRNLHQVLLAGGSVEDTFEYNAQFQRPKTFFGPENKPEEVQGETSADNSTDISSVFDDSISETTEDTSSSDVESLVSVERHCMKCVEYPTFVNVGGKTSPEAYYQFCEQMHSVKDNPKKRISEETRGLIERRLERSRKDRFVDTVPPGKNVNRYREKRRRLVGGSNILEAIEEVREEKEQEILEKPSYLRREVKSSNAHGSWEDRKARFDKLYATRPNRVVASHSATGETLWDLLFNITADKRLKPIPWRKVLEFPQFVYPEEDCVFVACADALGKTTEEIAFHALRAWEHGRAVDGSNLPVNCLWPVSLHYGVRIEVQDERGVLLDQMGVKDTVLSCVLKLEAGHLSCLKKLNSLVIEKKFTYPTHPSCKKMMSELNAWEIIKWIPWEPERKRANDYIKAMREGEVSILMDTVNSAEIERWERCTDTEPPNFNQKWMCVVIGDPGCRKSSRPQKIFAKKEYQRQGNFSVILPTRVLSQDWKDKLDATYKVNGRGMPGEMVSTLDRALAKYNSGELIVTDENKFPKGYIAAFHLLNPEARYHLFLADPWQTSWHNPSGGLLNDPDILGEAELYLKYAKGYLVGTWRLPPNIANFWRMPTFSKMKGGIYFTDVMPTTWNDLVPVLGNVNPETVHRMWVTRKEFYAAHYDTMWADQLRQADTNSYAGSQGLTVPLAIVAVDARVLSGSDPRLIYTAMTRSQYIVIVRQWRENGNNERLAGCHPVFRHLEYYRHKTRRGYPAQIEDDHSVEIRDITFPFPRELELILSGPKDKLQNADFVWKFWEHRITKTIDPDEHRAGARLRVDEPAYVDRPDFHAYIDPTEEFRPPEPMVPEAVIPDRIPQTHLPVESEEAFVENHNSQVIERYDAELRDSEYSDQFPDTPIWRKDSVSVMRKLVQQMEGRSQLVKRRKALSKISKLNLDENPLMVHSPIVNWGMRQLSKDSVTFRAAKRQRLNFASEVENMQNYIDQREFGMMCWSSFRSYMGWQTDVPFDDTLFSQSVEDFQFRRGLRSEAMKKGSLSRADPDGGIVLTQKGQLKLKKREFEKAKPGQPVMIHTDKYLFEHGPYGMYMLEQIMRNKPDHWHFHARKTHKELEDWCLRHFPKDVMLAMNDLKAQDQSVQGWAVVFMEHLFRYFNLPNDFIENFVADKLSKRVAGKTLAIMTDSGEIWTYLMNTMSCAARETFMYNMPYGHPMANGGDDTMRVAGLPVNVEYVKFERMDPCTDKRFSSTKGEFVSFIVKNGELFKDPILLLKRFLVKLTTGDGENSVDGYLLLWLLNYKKAEKLADCFDPDELEAHQLLTRIMFNLSKYGLKSRVKWDLENVDVEWASSVVQYDEEMVVAPEKEFHMSQVGPTREEVGVLPVFWE